MTRPSTVIGLRYHKKLVTVLYSVIFILAGTIGYLLGMIK